MRQAQEPDKTARKRMVQRASPNKESSALTEGCGPLPEM